MAKGTGLTKKCVFFLFVFLNIFCCNYINFFMLFILHYYYYYGASSKSFHNKKKKSQPMCRKFVFLFMYLLDDYTT